MDYAELATLLQRESSDSDVTAFPDGSIDTYYDIYDAGERLDSRATFSERITDDADTLAIDHRATKPGGQAVNIARQTHALGNETWLCGHLDDSVFDGLDFETVSMGAPASIFVYEFDDGDLMLADGSVDMSDWSLADVRTAMADDFTARLTADVVCCMNWASFPNMTDALSRLAASDLDGNLFVFDPGNLTTAAAEAVVRLCETLGDLEGTYNIILSADSDEIDYLADTLGISADDEDPTLCRLRERIGVTGVVRHGRPEATAATTEKRVTVSTIEADGANRQTGAGDRFSAGLAHGLGAGYRWEAALGVGNLCASYRVEYAETGTREALAEYATHA